MGSMARSAGIPQRLRSEGIDLFLVAPNVANQVSESWVDITSIPSTSSLSSIGDEIVTTGLRVQQHPNSRRRRSVQAGVPATLISMETRHTETSSQEEYEESESEEDHIMTSSNEYVPAARLSGLQQTYSADSEEEDDDDENATALGRRTEPNFTPQPNAFSHPPSRNAAPRTSLHRSSEPAPSRPSYPSRTSSRGQYQSYNQVDHDAALRASLTTLLSIGAAAARGLPKREQPHNISNQPMTLGLVPESEIHVNNAPNSSRPLSPSTRARSTPSVTSSDLLTLDSTKRKAKPSNEKARVAKKKKVQLVEEAMISPTMMTWVMSASVVVIVSVVGFGAGYVIGREVGRGEGLSALNGSANAAGCGREVVRTGSGLRRLKWGGVARKIVA